MAMKYLNLQLNTAPAINRDLEVELINEVSGTVVKRLKPYLDGSLRVRDLDPGPWRLKVRHPNRVYDLIDRPFRVLPDRPTYIPINIPKEIFSDTPIRDTPEADLEPERGRLLEAEASASGQGEKIAGQPIFAGDWNALAGTVADVAKTTVDLSQKVAPLGHDHPELVEKIDELQSNLERFFDVFGKTVVQLQRQMQKMALQLQTQKALDEIPELEPATRERIDKIIHKLDQVDDERPDLYTRELKRVGEMLHNDLVASAGSDEVLNKAAYAEAVKVAAEMRNSTPVSDYKRELETHKRIEGAKSTKNFAMLAGFGGIGSK